MPFVKATKEAARLRLAIDGPSGSGKSYTAIKVGCGLSHKRMAVIDTEHGSAHKYADLCDFDIAELNAPYSPERYIALMREAAKAGYDVIVLDSISHAWAGEGGVLEMVDEATMASRSRNSYTEGWRKGTPAQNSFVEHMLAYPGHIIATIRTKTEWVSDGRGGYRKIGLAPVQRAEIEYEFDLVLSMDPDHVARPSKTRFAVLDGRKWSKPGNDFTDELKTVLGGTSGGVPPTIPAPTPPAPEAESAAAPIPPAAAPSQESQGAEAVPTNVLATPASAPEKTVSAQWLAGFEKKRQELGWTNGQAMAWAMETSQGRTDKPGMLTVVEANGLGKELRDALVAGDMAFVPKKGDDNWEVGTPEQADKAAEALNAMVAETEAAETPNEPEPEATAVPDDKAPEVEEHLAKIRETFGIDAADEERRRIEGEYQIIEANKTSEF